MSARLKATSLYGAGSGEALVTALWLREDLDSSHCFCPAKGDISFGSL
jgi:hypothetical protein